MLNIAIVCSDAQHPVYPFLLSWKEKQSKINNVTLVNYTSELGGEGDFLFLISCAEIVPPSILENYTYALVIHASDLPDGRGWSPLVWQILEGKREIVVSLLEAKEPVDSGDIWVKKKLRIEDHELLDEINEKLFNLEVELMDFAISEYSSIDPAKQVERENLRVYRKREPSDSQLDVEKTLAEQFNLLRVCDKERYPAYLEYLGHRYKISIEKI